MTDVRRAVQRHVHPEVFFLLEDLLADLAFYGARGGAGLWFHITICLLTHDSRRRIDITHTGNRFGSIYAISLTATWQDSSPPKTPTANDRGFFQPSLRR